jgi:hypothetical protein
MDSFITSKKVSELMGVKRIPNLINAFESNKYFVTYNNPTLTAKKDDNTYTLNLGDYPHLVFIKLNNEDQKILRYSISNDDEFVKNIYEVYKKGPIMESECPVCLVNIPTITLSCKKHTICYVCEIEMYKINDVRCPICRFVGDGGQIKQMNIKRNVRKRSVRKRKRSGVGKSSRRKRNSRKL